MTPAWVQTFARMAQRIQEISVLSGSPVYYKGYNSGAATWRRGTGPGVGRGGYPRLSRHHSPSTSMGSPIWKLSEPQTARIFMEVPS